MGSKQRAGGAIEVAGVRLSSPEKVMYEESGVTKLGLARYYEAVAERMLPHVRDRPLSLVRCPSGRGRCFYQKHIDDSVPKAVIRVPIEEQDGSAVYGAVDSPAGLVALVQLGVLEIHGWGCRRDRVERPDRMTIDLDPGPSVGWEQVVDGAELVRDVLAGVGLVAFARVTGGKGVHVVAPIARRSGWEEVKEFTRSVCALIEREQPGRYTLEVAKSKRPGRILLDYLRNARGSTAIESYSTRARAGAPVAVPVAWEELRRHRPAGFDLEAAASVAVGDDPWADYFDVGQSLTARMRKAVTA